MRRFLAYAPAILWALLLLFLGGRHITTPEAGGIPIDKIGHFFVYGILGALAAIGWLRAGRRHSRLWPIALAIGIGLVDELHQSTLTYRTADPVDLAADAAGIVLFFTWVVRRKAMTRTTAS